MIWHLTDTLNHINIPAASPNWSCLPDTLVASEVVNNFCQSLYIQAFRKYDWFLLKLMLNKLWFGDFYAYFNSIKVLYHAGSDSTVWYDNAGLVWTVFHIPWYGDNYIAKFTISMWHTSSSLSYIVPSTMSGCLLVVDSQFPYVKMYRPKLLQVCLVLLLSRQIC